MTRGFEVRDQESARAVILAGLGEHFGFIDTTCNPDIDDIEKNYISKNNIFVVAHIQECIIGTGALIIEKNDIAHLVRMSVKKDYRRKGIGKLILNYLIKKAKKRKIKKLILETEHNWNEVVAFYKKLGFVEYKRDNVDVFMALDLSNVN